jgi:hypothetical protein
LSARIAFWSFDGVPDGAAQIPASARSGAATLTASGGAVVVERLAFRGTERCPGTTTCGLTLFERGGECGEVDGSARCACSTGYAGAECVECPGGAKNPCSGTACASVWSMAPCARAGAAIWATRASTRVRAWVGSRIRTTLCA